METEEVGMITIDRRYPETGVLEGTRIIFMTISILRMMIMTEEEPTLPPEDLKDLFTLKIEDQGETCLKLEGGSMLRSPEEIV